MIGKNIKALRKKTGLTQKKLANRMNTTHQSISDWELGNKQPKVETLKKIADALGCSVNDLI